MSDQSRPRVPAMWLGVALLLSLAVNTFFVGLVMGSRATSERWVDRIGSRLGLAHHVDPRGLHGMPPALDPRHIGRVLPESAHERAREIFEARAPEIHGLFEEAAIARVTAYDAMRAEPFDREALEAAFTASRVADQAAAAAVHDLTAEIVSRLTPEERAAIETEIGHRFPEMHHWRDRRDHFERMRERRERRPPWERRS